MKDNEIGYLEQKIIQQREQIRLLESLLLEIRELRTVLKNKEQIFKECKSLWEDSVQIIRAELNSVIDINET